MQIFRLILAICGRLFIGFFFLISGAIKFGNWASYQEAILSIFNTWNIVVGRYDLMANLLDFLTNHVSYLLGFVIFCELIGGASFFLGVKKGFGACLLILYLVPMIVIAHPYWLFFQEKRDMELNQFLISLAILGGVLLVASKGSGKEKKQESGAPAYDTPSTYSNG